MKRDPTYYLCPKIKDEVFTNGLHEVILGMVCDKKRGHKGKCEHRVALPGETRWLTLVNELPRNHSIIYPKQEQK